MADDALRALARDVEIRERTQSRIRASSRPTWSPCAPGHGSGECSTCRCGRGSSRCPTSRERPTIVRRWCRPAETANHHYYALVAPGIGYKVAEGEIRDEWDPDRPDRPVEADVTARLVEYVREAFPGLDPEPVHSEACLYTHSPDSDFILDTIDGVIVCGGDSGHAFKFGPLLGRLVADMAQGRALPPEASAVSRDRLAV